MSAETISSLGTGSTTPQVATLSDNMGGGAGRGGSDSAAQGPLVVVQQPRNPSPPRPAPRTDQGNTDNSLRNGYAAISHSVSGETAAIGIGFLAGGPIGAIVGGATLPVLLAASMWRARRREHDQNANNGSGDGSGRPKSNRDRSGSGGGRHKTPKGHGHGNGGGGMDRKPKVKDPVADKLSKAGKNLADKVKDRHKDHGDKDGKHKPGSDPKDSKDSKGKSGDTTSNTARDGLDPKKSKDAKERKDPKARKDYRGDYPDDRRWRGRGHKDKTAKPKNPKNGGGTEDRIFDAEIVDDGLPPKPNTGPGDVIDGEVIDEDRIALVKSRREKNLRRQAINAGKQAEKDAARDGTMGDPIQVKAERIRAENHRIDYELHHAEQMLALAASTEQRRTTPVTYPVATTQAAGTRTAGAAVARQIDVRGSSAYRILVAMAEQLANGFHNDADADMADHVVELAGIPALCRNLSTAVREAAAALQKTAPLHPSVVKHMNNAAVAALTAGRMADTILTVFVQAHRDDIFRVMNMRVGEERWNIRNAAGTLDAAKLRAAILSSGQQSLALPAGSTQGGATNSSSGKLIPASGESTKKLISLMKGFDRGHMVVCLSEVGGAAGGVEVVADSINKLYRRMSKTWPTEQAVDDTVHATASKVKTVAAELRKAIKAAQRAHQRELKLNAKPRKGAHAEKKWDVVQGRQG